MSSSSPTDSTAGREQNPRELLVEELERRIGELEVQGDDAMGRFTGWDWLLCVLGAVVVPALAMWWFAG